MKFIRLVLLSAALVASLTLSGLAGQVSVSGVHLCCASCVRDADKALTGIPGVSDATCDRAAKTVKFQAADDAAAQAGVDALAKAGFHGTAQHGDKAVAMPASGASEGQKADSVTVAGVHLCCGACVTAAKKAVESGVGGASVTVDRTAQTVVAAGSGLSVSAVVEALNKAGFHGTVK